MISGPYLTDRLTQGTRSQFDGTMAHTYTRVPTTPTSTNGWSETSRASGSALTGRPCRYLPRTTVRVGDGGYADRQSPPIHGAVIYREVLLLHDDDDLAADDLVQDVRDWDGKLLLAGPVPVVAVMDRAGLGPTTNRMAVLHGPIEEEPAS